MITPDRWSSFSRREQLLSIASELERARIWQEKDKKLFRSALERTMNLIDLTLQGKLSVLELPMFLAFRDEVARFYLGDRAESIDILYKAL